MAKSKTGAAKPDRYLELVRRFPLRPLRSEAELDRATAVINGLLDREDLDPAEEDYLDVLGDLVEKYEAAAHPMPPVSDAAMLRHLLDVHELTQAAVAEETGIPRSVISEVMAGKRRLSRANVERLARFFKVSPAVFTLE
jgi:HTH-type transcriptional regulator/antitoxin HigA